MVSSNLNEKFIQEANKLEGIWNSNKNAWGFTLDKQNKILKITENIYEIKPKLRSNRIEKI